MKQTFIGLLAIIAIGFAFTTCDNGGGKDTHTPVPCECGENEVHFIEDLLANGRPDNGTCCDADTELCKQRGCTIKSELTDDEKTFEDKPMIPSYGTTVNDTRDGKFGRSLEKLKSNNGEVDVVTLIQSAMSKTYEGTSDSNKARFVNVFYYGVVINVDNPTTLYKVASPDVHTLNFHVDYLKTEPDDIEANILAVIRAMAGATGTTMPIEIK